MSGIKKEIERAINESGEVLFASSDFLYVASKASASRVLRSLCIEGRLIRISLGIYARAEISSISGKPYVPIEPMLIALLVMKKLGVEARLGRAYIEYNYGISNQVPAAAIVNVGRSRISRKVKLGKRFLIYERGAS